MLLEQDQPADAAMPPAPAPDVQQAAQVDQLGQQTNEQLQQGIKTCADIINALVVFVNGKFSDQIDTVPGLGDQLRELEKTSAVTDVDRADLKLLQSLLTAVDGIKTL